MVTVSEDRLVAAIAQLRAYVDERFAEQTRWIVGWVTAVVTIVVGAATSIIIAVLG